MIKELEHLSYEENLRAVSAQPGKNECSERSYQCV